MLHRFTECMEGRGKLCLLAQHFKHLCIHPAMPPHCSFSCINKRGDICIHTIGTPVWLDLIAWKYLWEVIPLLDLSLNTQNRARGLRHQIRQKVQVCSHSLGSVNTWIQMAKYVVCSIAHPFLVVDIPWHFSLRIFARHHFSDQYCLSSSEKTPRICLFFSALPCINAGWHSQWPIPLNTNIPALNCGLPDAWATSAPPLFL